MSENSRRPFNGVNLRHERAVYEAGSIKQLITSPSRALNTQSTADCVVLEREERMHELKA